MTQREDVVAAARSLLGGKYRWAGTDPKTGLDCSNYVAWCYRQAGVDIPAGSYTQILLGKAVYQHNIQPGDIVYWGGGSHVGIYAGDGRVLNALNEERGIVDTSIDAEYGMPYSGARSLLPDDAPTEGAPPSKSPRRPRKLRRLIRQRRDA